MSKRPRKRKPVPQRTCVACRARRPKRELVRVVRAPEGEVAVDETGKRSGRGGYLCPDRSCWEVALSRGQLDRALRTELTEEDRTRLREYAAGL
ncbi:MAG: YlxR family protein [Anaerolineae bacterium]